MFSIKIQLYAVKSTYSVSEGLKWYDIVRFRTPRCYKQPVGEQNCYYTLCNMFREYKNYVNASIVHLKHTKYHAIKNRIIIELFS